MSGIAEILLTLGYSVSGSDLRRSSITDRLVSLGATVFEGHAAANAVGSGVVVTSSAVNEQNPEVMEARQRKIPVIQPFWLRVDLIRPWWSVAGWTLWVQTRGWGDPNTWWPRPTRATAPF